MTAFERAAFRARTAGLVEFTTLDSAERAAVLDAYTRAMAGEVHSEISVGRVSRGRNSSASGEYDGVAFSAQRRETLGAESTVVGAALYFNAGGQIFGIRAA